MSERGRDRADTALDISARYVSDDTKQYQAHRRDSELTSHQRAPGRRLGWLLDRIARRRSIGRSAADGGGRGKIASRALAPPAPAHFPPITSGVGWKILDPLNFCGV